MGCKEDSHIFLVIDEGNVMEEVSLILETKVLDNNVELESLSMVRSRFNQENSIGIGVSDSNSSSSTNINSSGANLADLGCSHVTNRNNGVESDIMQQVLEDNFYLDLTSIELDFTSFERVF